MALAFVKLQAAGNAYLAVDGRDEGARDWPALARAMGRPHFGVGSDGLLVVERSQVAPVRMRVFNTDGSEAEMSGNGIRLFAKFVLEREIAFATPGQGLLVETGAGVRAVHPRSDAAGRVVSARVGMGVPLLGEALRLEAAGRHLGLQCVDLGNPHAVALLEDPVEAFPLGEVGPVVQADPHFPRGVNLEIVNVVSPDRLKARVFERGEGETLASGTGATACAVAARAGGHTGPAVEVALPGGALQVRWAGSGEAELEGPAVEVFRGVWPD